MDRKIIFIDVDGTLVGFNDKGEYIPESAVTAIHQARANGHKVYLCTGRSKGELYDYIMEIGFDGVVGAAGGFVESDGEMIFHKPLPVETVHELMDFFQENQVHYYLESNAGLFCEKAAMTEFARKFFPGMPEDTGFFGAMKDVS
jgi:Cof subfamily protein (haloacid dehalogenase superfamily)